MDFFTVDYFGPNQNCVRCDADILLLPGECLVQTVLPRIYKDFVVEFHLTIVTSGSQFSLCLWTLVPLVSILMFGSNHGGP